MYADKARAERRKQLQQEQNKKSCGACLLITLGVVIFCSMMSAIRGCRAPSHPTSDYAVPAPSAPTSHSGVDLRSSHIIVNGVPYVQAAGHIEPGKGIYYYDEGYARDNLAPQFSGTIVGFTQGEDTVTVQDPDGGYGTISRDVIRYQRMYWVME